MGSRGRERARTGLCAALVALAAWAGGSCDCPLLGGDVEPLPWPIVPSGETLEIGSGYGQYQNFGSPGYHSGLDILCAPGTPVRAIRAGKVTKVVLDGDPQYCGIMIGDADDLTRGWAYWHLAGESIQYALHAEVAAGDTVGEVFEYDPESYSHVHLQWTDGDLDSAAGDVWTGWRARGNPLSALAPVADTSPPVIEDAGVGSAFLFRGFDPLDPHAWSSGYGPQALAAGVPLSGTVDVIARIHDETAAGSSWSLAPYRVALQIFHPADSAEPSWSGTMVHDGVFCSEATDFEKEKAVSEVLYKTLNDGAGFSLGNYTERDFYYIVSNLGEDPDESPGVARRGWDTSGYDGECRLVVTVADFAGNEVSREAVVDVDNGP